MSVHNKATYLQLAELINSANECDERCEPRDRVSTFFDDHAAIGVIEKDIGMTLVCVEGGIGIKSSIFVSTERLNILREAIDRILASQPNSTQKETT